MRCIEVSKVATELDCSSLNSKRRHSKVEVAAKLFSCIVTPLSS